MKVKNTTHSPIQDGDIKRVYNHIEKSDVIRLIVTDSEFKTVHIDIDKTAAKHIVINNLSYTCWTESHHTRVGYQYPMDTTNYITFEIL